MIPFFFYNTKIVVACRRSVPVCRFSPSKRDLVQITRINKNHGTRKAFIVFSLSLNWKRTLDSQERMPEYKTPI